MIGIFVRQTDDEAHERKRQHRVADGPVNPCGCFAEQMVEKAVEGERSERQHEFMKVVQGGNFDEQNQRERSENDAVGRAEGQQAEIGIKLLQRIDIEQRRNDGEERENDAEQQLVPIFVQNPDDKVGGIPDLDRSFFDNAVFGINPEEQRFFGIAEGKGYEIPLIVLQKPRVPVLKMGFDQQFAVIV